MIVSEGWSFVNRKTEEFLYISETKEKLETLKMAAEQANTARYNSRALLVFSLFCLHLPAKYWDTFLPSQQSLLFPEAESVFLLLHFPELSFGSSPICQ